MKIIVENTNWGFALKEDIEKLLTDASEHLCCYFDNLPPVNVCVKYNITGGDPYTSFRNSTNEDFVVWLNTRDTYWCQYAYQFSHELCHILSNYDRLGLTKNQWFQESICEMASIFTLKRMAYTWQTDPPYPRWDSYSIELDKYAEDLINKGESFSNLTLKKLFESNRYTLASDPYNRALNRVVAVQLLPLFQNTPDQWPCICYQPSGSMEFDEYLTLWHASCPKKHQNFVEKIAEKFEFVLN